MLNGIFVICGIIRTFEQCIDNIYENVINNLFNENDNIYILFYLKITDPGPKDHIGWNFSYTPPNVEKIIKKIQELNEKVKCFYHIALNNEISDQELMGMIKDRSKYVEYISDDKKLLRALHCHYNFKRAGDIINEIQKTEKIQFDFYIYIRPDLYFFEKCIKINEITDKLITLALGPNSYNNDHFAIIPKKYFKEFFYDRINLIKENDTMYFNSAETMYWQTILPFIVKKIGSYEIKREFFHG